MPTPTCLKFEMDRWLIFTEGNQRWVPQIVAMLQPPIPVNYVWTYIFCPITTAFLQIWPIIIMMQWGHIVQIGHCNIATSWTACKGNRTLCTTIQGGDAWCCSISNRNVSMHIVTGHGRSLVRLLSCYNFFAARYKMNTRSSHCPWPSYKRVCLI